MNYATQLDKRHFSARHQFMDLPSPHIYGGYPHRPSTLLRGQLVVYLNKAHSGFKIYAYIYFPLLFLSIHVCMLFSIGASLPGKRSPIKDTSLADIGYLPTGPKLRVCLFELAMANYQACVGMAYCQERSKYDAQVSRWYGGLPSMIILDLGWTITTILGELLFIRPWIEADWLMVTRPGQCVGILPIAIPDLMPITITD